MKKRTKRIFALHHWCGLAAGSFLLVMSLSGAVLVFHEELDDVFFKDDMTLQQPAGQVSFDSSFELIRTNNPGWEIRVPALPRQGHALKYELRKGNLRKWIFVHPHTGQILNTIDRADKRLVHVLLTLHYSFFAGTAGKIFVFILAIAFTMLLTTGIILYRKSLARVLLFQQRFSLRSKRAFFSSVHRLLGVWGLMLNIVICVTGIRIAYVVASAALTVTPVAVNVPPMHVSIDRTIASIRKLMPAFEVTYLRFPPAPAGELLVLGHLESDPSYYGRLYSSIAINYHTGKVERITLLKDKPLLDRFLTVLQPLHFGDYAGIWVKLLYTTAGLLPGILAVSGFFLWRYRKPDRRRRLSRRSPDSRLASNFLKV